MKFFKHIYTTPKKCFALIFLVVMLAACRSELSQQTLNHVTELENILAEAEDNLAYDEAELKQRLDSMRLKLDFIKKHAKDSGNEEMKSALIRYSAIARNYKAFLDELPVAMYDLEQYKSEFNEIKDNLLHGEITEKSFEEQYPQLKIKYISFERKTRALAYKTFSIEGEFMRNDEIISARYKMLKQRFRDQ